ncbi:MAG: DNA polymerase III subunit alpha, partial [Bacteroidaceae bacterium]|nr:DNA polymerase III subunit alpha [Bacteroidaceae bacterium]
LSEDVAERIKFELHVMKTMGFPGYFLIVQDYINAARHELDVAVGPGRGSAAGSVVAYCLGITKVDPIKYDLLFERFLNPDRISLPDIDVDFDDDGRGKVLSWVTQKYGEEKVSHIITYGTMATKLAIKDVARVQKIPIEVSDKWCKAIPDRLPDTADGQPRKMNLANVLECVDVLRDAECSTDPTVAETIKYARMLEGTVRNTGVHACGVIICRDVVSDWVPVSTAEDKDTGERVLCTQYEGSVIEDTGLIKMDFLGLKNLSVIKECVENVRDSLGLDIDPDLMPITDAATYKLYQDGRTIGTFQFESAGMQKYLRDLKPTVFEDLIAMNALYRPGPMDYIPDFIDRKHGRKAVTYDIPCMEKYLKDTYGITVYQEQVMLLSRQLANFTRGESDTLRKAMGKKMKDKLDHMKPKFITQGQANGHDAKVLEKIWADWEKFASYAFNKSHATCYSWVAFQTAYLKANFPSQYMAACLSRSLSDIKEITKLMTECKSMGIKCLPPNINVSRRKFAVDECGNIIFGLAAIKGVGEGAVEIILTERDARGPFTSIFDFVKRVPVSAVKRSGLECLALSGAFDCFAPEITREQFFALNTKGETFLDVLTRFGNSYLLAVEESRNSLFGDIEMVEIPNPVIPQALPWSTLERLEKERGLVGIYLSAHPLDDYKVILRHVCNVTMSEYEHVKDDLRTMYLGGIVVSFRESVTRRDGNKCGFAKIEDFSGVGEVALFGEDYVKYAAFMREGNAVFITRTVQPHRYKPSTSETRLYSVNLLSEVKDRLIEELIINLHSEDVTNDCVEALHRMASANPGHIGIRFRLTTPEGRVLELRCPHIKVSATQELISCIEEFGTLEVTPNLSIQPSLPSATVGGANNTKNKPKKKINSYDNHK